MELVTMAFTWPSSGSAGFLKGLRCSEGGQPLLFPPPKEPGEEEGRKKVMEVTDH